MSTDGLSSVAIRRGGLCDVFASLPCYIFSCYRAGFLHKAVKIASSCCGSVGGVVGVKARPLHTCTVFV